MSTEPEVFSAEAIRRRLHVPLTPAQRAALLRTVDCLARIAVQAHFHRADFVERYGEEGLTELLAAIDVVVTNAAERLEDDDRYSSSA